MAPSLHTHTFCLYLSPVLCGFMPWLAEVTKCDPGNTLVVLPLKNIIRSQTWKMTTYQIIIELKSTLQNTGSNV